MEGQRSISPVRFTSLGKPRADDMRKRAVIRRLLRYPLLSRRCPATRTQVPYGSDLGAAPGTAGRILRFANPISGQPLTTIEVRKPAALERGDGADDDN